MNSHLLLLFPKKRLKSPRITAILLRLAMLCISKTPSSE